MAKIRKEDLFDSNLFKGTTAEINTMIEAVKKLKEQMIGLMEVNKKALSEKRTNSSEGLKKQAEATRQVSQADQNLIKLEKERVRLVNRLNQTSEKQAKNNARLKVQIAQRNKQLKDQARNELKLVGAYEKQSKTLNSLRKRYKDLLVAGKGNTKEAKRLAEQVGRLDKKLKQVDASAGQYQRNVGNYGNKLKSGFQSLMGAVGVTAGITGVVRGLRSAINVVTDFDQSIANLGAISQATDKEMKALTDNTRKLGGSTKFTASEVANLSIELAKLGFSPEEIIESSEAILSLSAATGKALPEAAAIAGSTLRAFGLEASEMERVASTLGVATTKSALNMEFFETAMSKVAPVAASLGFELEDTTALLGTLANSGFDASTAATSTKNILLKLADSSGDLAQKLGKPVKNLDDLIPALRQLKSEGVDLAEALELTDKRSVAAFKTFIEGTDTMSDLRDNITDVNQELADMAAKQLDTVNGQMALLNSKWQEMILGTSESTGAVSTLKSAIAFLTTNLEKILKVIKFVAIAFISYKTAVLAQNVALTAYHAITKGARIMTLLFSGATKRAAVSMRGLNTAIKSNPIGLLVSVLTTAIALLWDYSEANDEVAESVDRLADAYDDLKGDQTKYFEAVDVEQSQIIANIDLEIAKAKEKGASLKELHDLELKRIRAQQRANTHKDAEAYENFLKMIELRNKAEVEFKKDRSSLGVYERMAQSTYRKTRKYGEEMVEFYKLRIKNSKLTLDNAQAEVDAQQKLLDDLENQGDLLETQIKTAEINLKIKYKEQKLRDKSNKSNKTRNNYAKELYKLTKDRLTLEEQIQKIVAKTDVKTYTKASESLLDAARKKARNLDFVDPDKDGDVNDINLPSLEEFDAQLKKIQEAEVNSYLKTAQFKSKIAKRENELYDAGLEQQVKKGTLSRLQADQLIIDADKNLKKELDIIRAEYDEKEKESQDKRKESFDAASKEIKEIALETNQKGIDDRLAAEEQRLQELSETIQATNALLDWFQRQNDERARRQIENIDKEIEASKKRYDELKKLSIQGNEDAEQSALYEIKRQEEAERQKQKIQRNQQLVAAGLAAFKVFAAKVETGDPNPLSSTIADMTALTAFVSSLPTFWEGTENVGDSLGSPDMSGRDGHVVRVDSNERIVDVANNKKMLGISNDELGDLAWSYKNQSIDSIKYNKLTGNAYEMMASNVMVNYSINKQLDEMNRSNRKIISAIEHIPHESWDYDRMSDAVIQKIKTQKKTEIRHYKNNSLF